MSRIISENMIIEGIDLLLSKFGLIYKQNINNYFDSNEKKRIQKFKSYVSSILMFGFTIRWFILLLTFNNKSYSLFYNDFIRSLGGITEFHYIKALFISILSFQIHNQFNY
jgi:hypothetical protein